MDAVLHSSENMGWETPESFLDLVRELCGGRIALDSCTTKYNPTRARVFFTEHGLEFSWLECANGGLTYANTPYGDELAQWVDKAIAEAKLGCEILTLWPARIDTGWYDRACRSAAALCEVKGRLRFKGAEAGAPFPSAAFYWGERCVEFCEVFGRIGRTRMWDPQRGYC